MSLNLLKVVALAHGLLTSVTGAAAASSSISSSTTPVITTALPGTDTPPNHWTPNRTDPYICEYLGESDCWQPTIVEEGQPYMGFGDCRPPRNKTCIVPACNDPSNDDAPAIRQAFSDCRENSHIIFEDTTYYIASVMNTTGLRNVDVEVRGTLAWNNSDIDYWLNNSLPVGFQNQSSA